MTIDGYSSIYRPTCSFVQSACRDEDAWPTPLQSNAFNVSLLIVANVLNKRREVQVTVQSNAKCLTFFRLHHPGSETVTATP